MNLNARPSFVRTLIGGFVSASLVTSGASGLADGNKLGWMWLAFGAAALWILISNVREQSMRGLNKPHRSWTRSDTGNVIALAALAALPLVDIQFSAHVPPTDQAVRYALAALYAALLADFTLQRRSLTTNAAPHPNPEPAQS